jgi:rhamnogalacturonan endolyase
LRAEAEQFASPTWNTAFYDSIAHLVPNYIPSTQRSTWKGRIDLPKGAKRPIAVLAQNGVDFQDNVLDTKAYQYWGDIDRKGNIEIPMVKPGTYRLTVYADGIFGQYIQDDVVVALSKVTTTKVKWREESAGKELWRIGTPDRSSGEYRHGNQPDPSKPLHPPEYRIYWASWDFPIDYPNGVTFEVGKSEESKDFNYGMLIFCRHDCCGLTIRQFTGVFLADMQIRSDQNHTMRTSTTGLCYSMQRRVI